MKIQYVIYKENNEHCIFALPEIKIQACPNKVCIELVHEIIECKMNYECQIVTWFYY